MSKSFNYALMKHENHTKQRLLSCYCGKKCLLVMVAMICVTVSFAQRGARIEGSVRDEMGVPLAGVNILESGTRNGTVTDQAGNDKRQTHDTQLLDTRGTCSGSQYKICDGTRPEQGARHSCHRQTLLTYDKTFKKIML